LRYVDPTGAVLELTGDDKGAAFDRIKRIAGSARRETPQHAGKRREPGAVAVSVSRMS
jgi:hypothetical protein